MKLHKAYKYKLSPNATQKQQFEQILGSCCYLYNIALEQRITIYQATGKGINYYDQANELPVIKKTAGLEWFKLVPSQTGQKNITS